MTVAVPTAEEARALFNTDLIKAQIQPVWVMVENHSDRTYYLSSTGTDPNYFSAMETVYAVRAGLFGLYRDEMERYFRSMNFRDPVLPYTAVSRKAGLCRTGQPGYRRAIYVQNLATLIRFLVHL